MSVRDLDCTLRDGGYYNSWRFSDDLVANYLSAVSRAGVDFVEIGFRNFPQPSFVGPYAYSTDDFLETLPILDDLNIGLMIDAKTVLNSHGWSANGGSSTCSISPIRSDRFGRLQRAEPGASSARVVSRLRYRK
jgi:hypothetical protein